MSSAKILNFLVNDILDYAQISAGKFRKQYLQFNLKECVDEIVLILQFKADQLGVNVECSFTGFNQRGMRSSLIDDDNQEMLNIILDQQRLQQMLLNLISNAIKFTPSGGNVNIICKFVRCIDDLTVQDAQLVEPIENAMQEQDNQCFLEVAVCDTGVGISDEDQKKLFQIFGFLDNTKEINTKGIGLGLHITKKIAKIFDGDIICRSKPGEGSKFIFLMAINGECQPEQMVTRITNPV